MKFFLDDQNRFLLSSLDSGWELFVDDKKVLYCKDPTEAVRYLGDELMNQAIGLEQVFESMSQIKKSVEKASKTVNLNKTSSVVAEALSSICEAPDMTRQECVKNVSLFLAGCTESELRVRADRHEIIMRAKTMLEPCFEIWGIQ